MGFNIDYEGGNLMNWGKFGVTHAFSGFSAADAARFVELVEKEAKNMRVLIIESYVEDIFEDVITNFGVVFKGNTLDEVEEYLKGQLHKKYIKDNEMYYFDVYQFNAPDQPEVIERYVMNNLSLYKCIDRYEVEPE